MNWIYNSKILAILLIALLHSISIVKYNSNDYTSCVWDVTQSSHFCISFCLHPSISLSFFLPFSFSLHIFPFSHSFFLFFSFCHRFCVRHYFVSDTRAFWRICFCQMLYSTSRGKTDKLEEPVNRELNVIRSWNFIQILNLAWFIDWMSCKLICIFYNLKAPLLENR